VGRNGNGVELRDKSIRVGFVYQGKWVRETLKLAPTPANEKHAIRLVAEVRRRIANGTFEYAEFFPESHRAAKKTASTTSFGERCKVWLETKGRLADNTKEQYRNALEVWKVMLGAETPIEQIDHDLIASKVGSHPWKSAKLLNNYLIPLRGVFELTGRKLKLKDNPMTGIENSKHQAVPPDPLSLTEMESILADLKRHYDPQIWAYFEFQFMTGLRPEEAIALKWEDVDWNHGTVRVQRAKIAGKIKDLKTYQVRDVDLVERALEALKAQKPFTLMKDADIFQNPVTGRPWHDERSQRDHYWKPALRRCGVRYRRAYQTRHTYAANALMAGVNPAYISRQMGHKSAKMLFSVYAKWIDGADRGRERAKLEASLISPEFPQESDSLGRRDWTRTNSRGRKSRGEL